MGLRMSGQELRRRQRIVSEVARQFIEPIAWTGAATTPDELARAHQLARQALALRQDANFPEAVQSYDQALALFRASDSVAQLDLARLLFDRAACLHRMRKPRLFPDALAGYAEARTLLREAGDCLAVADCLLNTGACYDDWDNDQKSLRTDRDVRPLARQAYNEALALYEQAGAPTDVAWCLMLRGNFLGKYAREAKQPRLRDEAIVDLNRALDLLPDTETIARAQALVHLGNCLNEANQFEQAIQLQMEACDLLCASGEVAEDRMRAAIHTLAIWYFNRDCPDQALPYITEATALAERLAQRAGNRAQVLDRRAQVLTSYQLAIRIALKRSDLASAYVYAQRAKERTLFDLLDRDDAAQAAAPGACSFGSTELPSLADLGQALRPGEALLDFHTLDKQETLLALLLLPGANTVAWHREINGKTLGEGVSAWRDANNHYRRAFERYRKALDEPDLSARSTARTRLDRCAKCEEDQALEALGRELIDPALPLLAAHGVTTLILSPSAPLHQLPLAALRVGAEGEERGYLIDRFALSLAPSAATLALARRPQQPERAIWPLALVAAAPFCRVGDDDATPALMQLHDLAARDLAPRDRASGATMSFGALASLNRSGDEIRGVAAIVQEIAPGGPAPRLFLGAQATRAAVVPELRDARFIHLSTHGGKIDSRQSITDYTLFLAPDGDAQAPATLTVREVFDGAVRLDDVFSVVLSACHLGDAATQGAEAIGFAQAFLAAGAGVILAPVWAVADLPTAKLMIGWYAQLATPGRPDVAHAWQAAVQRLRRSPEYDNLFAHPHFWAGFLPTGDGALRLGGV